MISFTDDPVRDAENYFAELDEQAKKFDNENANELEIFDLDGEPLLEEIEKQYGCPMEELDEDDLLEILESQGIEADEAKWNECCLWIEYR